MLALAAMLIFSGAFAMAAAALYVTVRPALPKIAAALSGPSSAVVAPAFPPRRPHVRRVTERSAPATAWRAVA